MNCERSHSNCHLSNTFDLIKHEKLFSLQAHNILGKTIGRDRLTKTIPTQAQQAISSFITNEPAKKKIAPGTSNQKLIFFRKIGKTKGKSVPKRLSKREVKLISLSQRLFAHSRLLITNERRCTHSHK